MKKLYASILVLALACVALLSATKIGDPDTVQYLASGRYTLEHGLESGCVFTYASDQCQVVYPQWLFHVLTYAIYRVGGWNGLVALQIACAVGLFGFIVTRVRREAHPLIVAALLLLAAMVARERFILRADLFALLPAVLLYDVLDAYWSESATSASRRASLFALAGIQAVWANTHGSFYVGFVILGAFLAESVFTRRPGWRPALEAAGAVVVASLLNPFGWKAFTQPLLFMLGGEKTAPQLEFVSPFAPADLEHLTVAAYKVLLVVLVALAVLSFRALRVRQVVILAAVTYLSLTGIRYIALFAVFSALFLPGWAEAVRARLSRLRAFAPGARASTIAVAASALLASAIAVIAWASFTNRIYRYDAISRRTGFGVSGLAYPEAAADFVERNDLRGNLFNDYSIGTYLNWRLFPARKTFIDGHTYTPERLAEYRKLMAGGTPYAQVVDRFGIGFFILGHKAGESRDLIAKLYRDDGWALVYFDEMAVVFVKRTPENEALIARYRFDPAALRAAGPAPLANVRDAADAYLGHTDRGLAYSTLGLDELASAELETAAKENSRSFVTLTALALVREQRGDAAGALEACERAVKIRPGYAQARFWLGILDLRRKRFEEGIAELRAALHINPKLPLAHFNLGAAYEKQGDKPRALEHYRKELELNPSYRPSQAAIKRLG